VNNFDEGRKWKGGEQSGEKWLRRWLPLWFDRSNDHYRLEGRGKNTKKSGEERKGMVRYGCQKMHKITKTRLI
jgi:hypothetical protein